jgi:hypothetical protein
MILKLGPLLDVNFKSKVQLYFAYMNGCEIVVTVSWDFLQILGSNSLMIKINGSIYSSFYESMQLWEPIFRVQLITVMGIKFESL